ncbi:MAG: hypothetical protein R2911_09580 [Caldilineaceae bacterium]
MAVVKTLGSEAGARYRLGGGQPSPRVHEATDRRVGYVHIPDMGNAGTLEVLRLSGRNRRCADCGCALQHRRP